MDEAQIAKVKSDLSWVQRHERILALFLVLVVAAFLGNKWIDHQAAMAHDNAIVATEVAKQAQKEADAKLAESTAVRLQYEKDTEERYKEVQSLLSAIAQRDKVSQAKVIAVSGPKTPPEAVKDIEALYNVHDIVPTDIGAVVPTADLQLFSATKITADTCRQDLTDTQAALKSSQDGETQAQGVIVAQQHTIDAKDVAAKAQKTADDKVLADVKAEARKSKRNWFVAGYVAGVATSILVHLIH